MLDRVRRFIEERGLVPPGARLLVGYSGGSDSTCLLHLLRALELECMAAYLHHGQRPEADREQERCAQFAQTLGIPFVAGRADVPAMAKELKIGLEEAGREARYAFFAEAAAQTGCSLIATAHTRTDHAETVLLNLVRGAGLDGLAGIPVKRENIIRPLLCCSREETNQYCRDNALPFGEDSTNRNLRFARARLREIVFPELRGINPGVEAAIERLAETAWEESEFLDAAAAAALERCEILLNDELRFVTLDAEARFDRLLLAHLPPVLLKRGLRLVVEALGGKLSRHLTLEAHRALEESSSGSLTAEEGRVCLEWHPERLHISKTEKAEAFKGALSVPGEAVFGDYNWRLSASLADNPREPSKRQSLEVHLDVDGFRGPLHFRSVRPGDRMRPAGSNGHRKLSDLLGEAKTTLLLRQRLPILCDMMGPIWVPGAAYDERVRPSPESKKALRLVFSPLSRVSAAAETRGPA